MLQGYIGERRIVDTHVLLLALEVPTLIIDCANAGDPHRFTHLVNPESFDTTFIVPVDLIYTYRDALLRVARQCSEHSIERIVITTQHKLFNYQDAEENADIFAQCWELLARLGRSFDVHVAVAHKHLSLARTFCDQLQEVKHVGHTVSSQRQVIDRLLSELRDYGKALRQEDLRLYEELLRAPLQHLAPITNASSIHAWAFLLLSVCLEQQRQIEELQLQVRM